MIKIELGKNLEYVSDTAEFVSRIAGQNYLDERRKMMLCFALETMLELRMKDLSDENPTLLIEMEVSGLELAVSVTDKGVPYILTKNQKRVLQRGLVDRFKFEQLASQGQKITFYCDIENEKIKRETSEQEEQQKVLDDDIRCELTKPRDEDVIEAIRCLWDVYRYEYGHSKLYDVDCFKELLKDGEFVSILARNAHGQTLGHAGLDAVESFPGMMELCSLVIKKYARGYGIANKLNAAMTEAGMKSAESGLFSRPVLFHGASQKLLNSENFTPCGVCLNYFEAESLKDKTFTVSSKRLHIAYAVKIFDKEKKHELFLPDECAGFIQNVFDKEGLCYDIMTQEKMDQTKMAQKEENIGESIISYEILTEFKSMEIIINQIGYDFEDRIKDILENESVEMVLIYLNMNDPSCPDVYKNFRESGYIFSGCFPGSGAGDYIILQDLKGIPFLREEIVAEPGYREMLEQIYEIMDR